MDNNTISSIITGSAQPKFNTTDLKNLEIKVLSDNTRKRTVDILKSIDSKISYIHLQNKILEKITQTIFKSMFVDFNSI